jgi:hypothetical protein
MESKLEVLKTLYSFREAAEIFKKGEVTLLEVFSHVYKEQVHVFAHVGLCTNFETLFGLPISDKLTDFFPSWPEFSGDCFYPIEGDYLSGINKYYKHEQQHARFRLLDFVIEQVEKECHETN